MMNITYEPGTQNYYQAKLIVGEWVAAGCPEPLTAEQTAALMIIVGGMGGETEVDDRVTSARQSPRRIDSKSQHTLANFVEIA